LKNGSVQTRRFVTVYQIGKLFGKYKQNATGPTAANDGDRHDLNIFRPHDFLLVSGDTDAAPVNHRTLVKTSDQPSLCSNVSPLTSADALRSSDITPVPSLN
jgi:hypothetical protein